MSSNVSIDPEVGAVSVAAEPVRVLFVVDSTFPGAGGAEAQARKLAKALKSRDVVLEFVSPRTVDELPVDDTVDGIPNHRIAYPHIKFLGAAILLIRFAWYLFKRRKDFDVIHVHITRLLAAVAVLMRPITGLPVIAKISGYFEFKGGILDPDSKNPANAFLRHTLRKLDYVQTISGQTRELLLKAGFTEKQITFIPNGVDVQESIRIADEPLEQPSGEEANLVFGYCGRLRQIKGVEELVEAFRLLVEKNPDLSAQLRIAGGGTLYEELTQRVESYGLTHCIEFLGTVENTHEFYKSLDVYIQPSFAEGLPNSVIEAMVAGLPVLATDIGGNNDLVTHSQEGWLFSAGDAPALTALMQRCINEREVLHSMGMKGRARIAETYDFSTVTKDLLDLYCGR